MFQTVWNSDKFGPLTNSSTVITVQVHNRITYLRHLIDSLSSSSNIENTVLVFSHDVWDKDINNLVRLAQPSQSSLPRFTISLSLTSDP